MYAQAGMDEDAPQCHKLAEVTRVPGPPQQRTEPSASKQGSHVKFFADIPRRHSMKQEDLSKKKQT